MSAYRVIDKMEVVVREGVWMPFGWKALNADLMLDLIEKLRSTLPEDSTRARKAGDVPGVDGSDVRSSAAQGKDASALGVPAAVAASAQENEIIARARARAETMVAEAQAAARDIRRGADEYADHVLAALDTSLAKALAAVQKGRQQLATSAIGNGKSTSEMSAV